MIDLAAQALKLRYYKPIEGIVDNIGFAGTVAFLATGLNELLQHIFGIFATDINLIVSLILLVLFDLLSGVYASYKKGVKISSLGLRSTVIKVVEYSAALISLTILSNMAPTLHWIQTWSYIFLCAVEVKSIQENLLLENTETRKLFSQFWKVLKRKNDIDINGDN